MNDITITKLNDVWLKVDTSRSILMELNDFFAFYAENYKFHPKVKEKIWDGKIRLFSYSNGLLPIGLYYQLLKFCKLSKYTINLDIKTKLDDTGFDKWLENLPLHNEKGLVLKLRDYQYNTVKKILFEPYKGLCECPTSSGKSLIQYISARWCLKTYKGKVLITVPTTSLVMQMRSDFLEYSSKDPSFSEKDIHIVMSGKEKTSATARVIISTWQSIYKLPSKYFDQFNAYLADESHLATSKNLSKITQSLLNCPVKAGVSGTFKESKSHLLTLVGHFGEWYNPVTTRELIDDGTISDLLIKPIVLEYDERTRKNRNKLTYQDEIKAIINDNVRNEKLCDLASGMAKQNKNVVVMFKQIKHGEELLRICKNKHDKVYFIGGTTKTDDRELLRSVAENDSGLIIVASLGVFSTGVNIKNLHSIFMCHPMKSKILILQSIGRILRKHGTKTKALFFDIVDNIYYKSWQSYSLKHGTERIKIYNNQKLDYKIVKMKR